MDNEEVPIETMMDRYAKLYVATREAVKEMEGLELLIKAKVRSVGVTVTHGPVTAEWRKGSTRVSWDSKLLDGYAVAHPEILPFRTVSETQAAVSLKVKTV